MKRLKNLLRWFNLGVIILTFLAYLSPYISPVNFWFFNFFGMAYPFLLFANILFVGIWLFRRNRYFLFSLCCILLGWNHFTSFVGFHFASSPSREGIKVVSFNTHGLRKLHHKEVAQREIKSKAFVNFIQQNGQVDILCAQEVNDYSYGLILEKLNFPHSHKIPYVNTAIFSNYPILKSGKIDLGKTFNSCVWVDIQVEQQKIRVYSVHLQSNRVSKEADQVIMEGQLQEKKTWSSIRTIIAKIKNNSKIRVNQATTIAADIAKSPYPVIVCGDFNETPLSYAYRILSEGLQDSFRKKGRGLGTTYAGNIPALRIDYILVDPLFKVLKTETWKEDYSDHYPVWSHLELNLAR